MNRIVNSITVNKYQNAFVSGPILFGLAWTFLLLLLGTFVLSEWLELPSDIEFERRVPGMDGNEKVGNPENTKKKAIIGSYFKKFAEREINSNGNWPTFRGPDLNNVCPEPTPLIEKDFDLSDRILWTLELGEGYAGAAVSEGRVYVLDYDEQNKRDVLRCFSLETGNEFWQRGYPVRIKRNHGISRTVPSVAGKYVVSFGPKCHVMCSDSETGDFLWGIDLVEKYESEVPLWYAGQCPLIIDGKVILATAGTKTLMIAVDLASGEILWETPNPNLWKMSHSSIVPMEFEDEQMFVYAAVGGICGVSGEGKILWEFSDWKVSVQVPSAVPLGSGLIMQSAGYGAGSVLLQLESDAEKVRVRLVERLKKTQFASEQQTPIYFDDKLFSIMPKDSAKLKQQVVCTDRSGKLIWSSGTEERFGLGPYLIADDKLWILSDHGELVVADAVGDYWKVLWRENIFEKGHDAWAPMAMTEGRLILREYKKMVCLDVTAEGIK